MSSKFFSELEIFSTTMCLSDFLKLWSPPTLTQTWFRRLATAYSICFSIVWFQSWLLVSALFPNLRNGHLYRNLFFPQIIMFWNYRTTVLMQHSLSRICTAVKWAFVWQMFMSRMEIRQTLGAMVIRIMERQLIRCFSIILRLPYFSNYQSHLI